MTPKKTRSTILGALFLLASFPHRTAGGICSAPTSNLTVEELSEKLLGLPNEEPLSPPYRPGILARSFLPTEARPTQAGDLRSLEALRDLFSQFESIEMRATTKGKMGTALGQATHEFRGMDRRFRLATLLKGQLPVFEDVEAAFDGVRSATWYKIGDFISWRLGPAPFVPTGMRNPLFLPVLFASEEDDGCPTCSLNLVDVQDQSRWAALLGSIRRGEGAGTLLAPGSLLDGEPFFFRILVGSDGLIAEVDLVRPNGHVFKAVRFSGYRSAGSSGLFRFPWDIVEETFSPEGAVDWTFHHTITLLRQDQKFTAMDFRLNLRKASIVIDEDARRLLKHPQLRRKEWARFLQ